MKLGVAEIIENASKKRSKEDKINYLRENQSMPLKQVLQYCFDPNIKWLLPEGKVPYTPQSLVDQESMFYSEARRLYLFVEGGHSTLKEWKRQQLFVELLEALAPADAELLCSIKDKKMPYKSINYPLVKEAFPEILP